MFPQCFQQLTFLGLLKDRIKLKTVLLYFLQIYSKGTVTKAGTFAMNSKELIWPLPVTSSMAPRARVIIYYIRSDGEVVADALTINVQGIFQNQV